MLSEMEPPWLQDCQTTQHVPSLGGSGILWEMVSNTEIAIRCNNHSLQFLLLVLEAKFNIFRLRGLENKSYEEPATTMEFL